MNRKFIGLLIIGVMLLCVSDNIWAASSLGAGTPTIYKTALARFEISNDGGATYITLFNGLSDYMDIASVNAGQAAGNFFAGLSIPDGTYTHVRVTPSGNFKMRGTVSIGGTVYYTKSDGTHSTSSADLAEATITVPVTLTANVQALSTPITVKNGVPNHKVRVSFNVSNTLELWDTTGPIPDNLPDQFYPAAPTVTMEIK